MATCKKLSVFCDKCKTVVLVEEGDRVLRLIHHEHIATFSDNERVIWTTETVLCPECKKKFESWLNQKEEG